MTTITANKLWITTKHHVLYQNVWRMQCRKFFVVRALQSVVVIHKEQLDDDDVIVFLWANLLSQNWQAKGFSPVWVLKCDVSWCLVENSLKQTSHFNAFDSSWIFMCWLRLNMLEYLLWHTWQLNGFSVRNKSKLHWNIF